MVGFAMELAAWMFVGAVGIVVLGVMMRCVFFLIELVQGVPSYIHEDPASRKDSNAPWIGSVSV